MTLTPKELKYIKFCLEHVLREVEYNSKYFKNIDVIKTKLNKILYKITEEQSGFDAAIKEILKRE